MVHLNKLKMSTYLFVLVLVLMEQSIADQRFCGKALTQALDNICVNGYNSKIKRSMDLDDYADNEVEDELPYPYDSSPFLAKIHGGSNANLMAKTRRRRHGIYDECCRKGCSYTELFTYCL